MDIDDSVFRMFLRERASFREVRVPADVEWSSQSDVLAVTRMLSFGNAGAKFRTYALLGGFEDAAFQTITQSFVSQPTVSGMETRHSASYFASALISAIRDFTDNDSGVDAACEGVSAAIQIGRASKGLRKAMRRQIRRTLDSPQWDLQNQEAGKWNCPFCGENTQDDGEGFPRVCHLNDMHPDALPARKDTGCATKWNRAFVWNHLVKALAGLVRAKSWPNHRKYFIRTSLLPGLDEHFCRPDAGEFPLALEKGCHFILETE
jgi:hypothetical protein